MPCPPGYGAGELLHAAQAMRHTGRSCPFRGVPAEGHPPRNLTCIVLQQETYHAKSCEGLFCTEISSAPTLILLPLIPFCLGGCSQSPQPCCAVQRGCSWAELSVCRHSPLSFAPLGSLEMSTGLLGSLLGNRMKESHVFPPSAGERDCFQDSGLAGLI